MDTEALDAFFKTDDGKKYASDNITKSLSEKNDEVVRERHVANGQRDNAFNEVTKLKETLAALQSEKETKEKSNSEDESTKLAEQEARYSEVIASNESQIKALTLRATRESKSVFLSAAINEADGYSAALMPLLNSMTGSEYNPETGETKHTHYEEDGKTEKTKVLNGKLVPLTTAEILNDLRGNEATAGCFKSKTKAGAGFKAGTDQTPNSSDRPYMK